MELRHLRYFVAVGEEQHYGRAAQRLRVAQPALSLQVQDLEEEPGFKLFERLSRGVKLSAAGKLFLEDARRILQEVGEATARAGRVASGRSGTLRVGFSENASWRGVVPEAISRVPYDGRFPCSCGGGKNRPRPQMGFYTTSHFCLWGF
jgi:DNA-binding transcriptional LysR family regulator